MNRKHQLVLCKKCGNESFDSKKGIVCSLTNEQPTFEGICSDFIEKEKVKKVKKYTPNGYQSNLTRYPALESVIGILNIFAWIVGAVTVVLTIFGIYGLVNGPKIDMISLIPTAGFLIQGLFVSFILIAISECIKVIIDIEKNTRNFLNKE